MIFEKNCTRFFVPLDPSEGASYIEPVQHEYRDAKIDKIYKLTAQDEYWINPTVDGRIYWERDSSCVSDFDEEL